MRWKDYVNRMSEDRWLKIGLNYSNKQRKGHQNVTALSTAVLAGRLCYNVVLPWS